LGERRELTRFAWLSIGTAIFTIALKVTAYFLTGSVGLLSDAVESGVNLVAAVLALFALTVAAMPPDDEHAYGHAKAEYLSIGAEGTMILVAAVSIAIAAVRRLLAPQPLESVGVGLLVSLIAAAGNLAVAKILARAGRQYRSGALSADAIHLMTDVWTTGGVLVGVAAVAITGWEPLDPLIALAVTVQIVLVGVRLIRQALLGLMDTALEPADLEKVVEVLEKYRSEEPITYHALRSRESGAQRFVSVHVQVPGSWSVQRGHSLMEELERDIRSAIQNVSVFTHMEPVEDPVSWQDVSLIRDDQH
jgi:cation diffusion facilitator family transporter